MALQSQTVDVPLIAMNQSWPVTAGVAGRLRALNNAIAEKWMASEAGPKLSVKKRAGFTAFSDDIRGTDGSASTKSLDGTSMLASRGQQLIASASASLFACSRTNDTWMTPDYIAPTNVLSESPVVNRGTVDELVDSCYLSSVRQTLTTWSTLVGASVLSYFHIADADGTLIRETSQVGSVATIVTKCVSDGSRFWIIAKPASGAAAYAVYCYDTDGSLLGSSTATITQDADYFDVTAAAGSNGFVFLQRWGAGPDVSIRTVTWSGSAVVVSPVTTSTGGCSTGRIAFLTNVDGSSAYYAVSVDGAGPYSFYFWSFNSGTLVGTRTTLATAQTFAPVEIAGRGAAGPTAAVALSFLNATPTPQLNYTEIWTLVVSTATLVTTKRSLTIVSRAFPLGDNIYVVGYYQGDPSALQGTNNIQQSTFYLVSLDYFEYFQVCGEWSKGTAYADWQRTTTASKWFQVSSVNYHQNDDSYHVALSFRARSFTTQVAVAEFSGFTAFGVTVDPVTVMGNKAVNSVGIKDFGFGSENRRCVEFANETLIPGARVTSWTSEPSNHGISLVPEMIAPVPAAAATGLTPSATYEVVCVAERTDVNGNRVRSIAGPPYSFQTGVGQRQVTYSGYYLQNDVGQENLTIALYRTAFVNGIQSTQHYKVTDDLVPLLNVVGGTTWSFVDGMTDADAANNEILYTDKNFLDRFPCPAFSDGCSDAQRSYVIGYDKAVWFSGTKAEGDATWFNPAFRLLLNNDIPKAVALLDTTLVIFGERANIYVVNVNALPGNDGSGGIPTPLALPLNHGCTGKVATCSEGVFFPSTQGGIWLLARSLTDVFIGKAVKEYVEDNGPCVDIMVDDPGKVCCLLSNGSFAVYDTVTQAWSTYTLPSAVLCATVNQGYLNIARGATTLVYQQREGVTNDGYTTDVSPVAIPIISTVEIQLQLGGVRNFKRIWSMQFEGTWLGAHDLTVTGYFDDDFTAAVETYVFTPDSTYPYIYELPPKVEECASVTLKFEDSFPLGASAGFGLSMLGFELGIQQGLDRLAPTTRRKPATT